MPTAKKARKIAFTPSTRDLQYLARCKRALRERSVGDPTDQMAIKLALALAYEKLGKVDPRRRPKKAEADEDYASAPIISSDDAPVVS